MAGDDKLRTHGHGRYPSPGDVAAWTEIAARAEASPADLMRCLAHDMPESVRLAAVSNPAHEGVAARMASGDPSAVVRAAVMLSPWIDEEARSALMADPDVTDAAARMTGDEDELGTVAYFSMLHTVSIAKLNVCSVSW